MPSQKPKPPKNPLLRPQTQTQQPQQTPQQRAPRNAFSLGGRRFNGNATRRGTRH